MKRILLALSGMVIGLGMNAQIIQSFPHIENFDAQTNCSGSCNATCNFTNGWSNVTGDYGSWITDAAGTGSGGTGPSVDHTLGTSIGKYVYFETSSPCFPTRTAWLHTPQIDLSIMNAPQFEFWYHMLGSTMGTLQIDVSNNNGASWNLAQWPATTDNQDLWQAGLLDLTAYSGDTVILRFHGISSTSFTSDMAIDDIRIYDLLPDDAGIAWVDSPSTPACNLGNNVWATVRNYGTDTLTSVIVDWDLNAVSQTTASFPSLYVLPGNDTTLFIGTAPITNGDQLKIWTSMPSGVTELPSGAGNDTVWQNVQTGLSGTYTLGGPGANFPSFDSTVQALAAYGVCGPIVFNVYDSVYTEQISIPSIIGMNATNTVTYRGTKRTATLTYAAFLSNMNFTLQLNDADYFTFDSLTIEASGTSYGRVIDFNGGCNWNRLENCLVRFNGTTTTTSTFRSLVFSTGGTMDENNSFINNEFDGGSYAFYWWGSSTTALEDGNNFTGNVFNNQYYQGVYLYYQDNTTFDHNELYSNTTYTGTTYALRGFYCDNEFKVTNNLILGDTATQGQGKWRWAIYLGNCDGTSSNHQLIANNMVALGDTVTTQTVYGMYLTNNGYQDVYHNSICISGAGTNSRALYATGGGGSNLNNNIFANTGAGYAIYLNSGFTFTNVDYNNYYAPNGTMGYFSGAQATLGGWQTATGFDGNSYNVDPLFYSKWDLHTCADTLNNAGTPTSVNTDFDLEARSATPDIGADEFATLTGNFLAADTAICPGDSIQIGMPGLNGTFAWSTGDSTATIWASNPATYILTASSACGSGSDNIVITNLPLPVASFTQLVNFYTVIFTSTATNATSWWWDFGDGNTSTQQNPTHLYAWPGGTFNVTHVAYNTCGNDTTVISVTADESTGLADNAFAAGVSVYPNPAVGAFNLSMTLNQGETVNVEVVSVTGAVVYSEALVGKQGTNVINVEKELASGSYFVRLRSEHNSAIKKLIIE